MTAKADTTGREFVAALDSSGQPITPVSRADAHRHGVWHRSVSIFVLNQYGEVLIERRSEHKDLFPGFYDIVGGHLQPGQKPVEAARQETYEELGLKVPSQRLERLVPDDAVIERVVLPEQAIVNLERKTIFLLRLKPAEEKRVLNLGAELLRLTPEELEERGTSGEVSRIEFWSWERLLSAVRTSQHRPIASGTLSAMSDDRVRESVSHHCFMLRTARREEFAKKYTFLANGQALDVTFDEFLFNRFLERPRIAAPIEELNHVFEKGPDQLAGAYELGPFRQVAAGNEYWRAKLRDPEKRYVRSLLTAIKFGQDSQVQQRLDQTSSAVETFVRDLLNFSLLDGNRFRDKLGNLADIAVGRRAVLVWLEHHSPEVPKEILDFPTGIVTKACLQTGSDILKKFLELDSPAGLGRLRNLVLLGLGASSADFNNPAFQRHLKTRSTTSDPEIDRFLDKKTARKLSPDLAGDHFLNEFYKKLTESEEPLKIAYLSGNAAQAAISLAIAQEILRTNLKAELRFVAKSGSPGNDLTFEDAKELLATCAQGVFSDLARFSDDGRFTLEHDGPQCHGLDPGRLSANISRVLAEAQVILAEGQAYAEIRGWKKPAYIAFRVNGRVAEAIHGISRRRGACGFVGLKPGVDHFHDFKSTIWRNVVDRKDERTIAVAGQTTAEYVRAILSENLELIARCLFQGSHLEACQQLQGEADRLGRTFARVLMGVASDPPNHAIVDGYFRDMHFPVFACGGGGGFSGVTLRALRMLGLPIVAGVPSTDDGGSTGELQRWLRNERGFVFGVGDMAAILQDALPNRNKQAVLAYRFDCEPDSLTSAVMERIVTEIADPTDRDAPIGAADDFLSFVCDQLNFARVIEERFRESARLSPIPIKGASIRNLNVVAAYELCGMLGDQGSDFDQSRLSAFYILQKALAFPPDLLVVPVTYRESVLYLDYADPIPEVLEHDLELPAEALANDRRRLFGQQYIDKLPHDGPRSNVGVVTAPNKYSRPSANKEYLTRLREAELFVMGAGSLVGSQLSQLVVPGVVDTLLERSDMRRILVLNHVKMDETRGMSLRDQIRLIEAAATGSASKDLLQKYGGAKKQLRISKIFTDIVVPRTIARELEGEMEKAQTLPDPNIDDKAKSTSVKVPRTDQTIEVYRNRYVNFLLQNPEVTEKYDITIREIWVLSYLDQPNTLYEKRSERGRYRGALFATPKDIEYLAEQGIQLRSIHEVDSIGKNWKFMKSEGDPSLEYFPGLVPEALVGIFRIALERTSSR